MKRAAYFFQIASACLLKASTAALTPRSPDNNLAGRDDAWDGVTPEMIEASIDALNNAWYNETDGRWNSTTAWWLTGNALQAVCDYMYTTEDKQYLDMAEGTVQKQSGPLPWWPEGDGDFRADSTDDTGFVCTSTCGLTHCSTSSRGLFNGWWALALVRLYDLTLNSTYLDIAELDEAYIYSYWNDTCGGGVIWSISTLSYKNAISNELYIKLAASLHNRVPGDTQYLDRALQAWSWFNQSGLINSDNLINDGLTDTCVNNGDTEWTYNQGVILGGLAELYLATGDGAYLDAARGIADAVLNSTSLSPGGILTESCEAGETCDNNQQAFKGIFARNLAELNVQLPDEPYSAYLASNAQSAWTNDRDGDEDLFGISWAGPYEDASVGTQTSVIGLLIANIWREGS